MERHERIRNLLDRLIDAAPEENRGAVELVIMTPSGAKMGAVRRDAQIEGMFVMTTFFSRPGEKEAHPANLYFDPASIIEIYQPTAKREEPKILTPPANFFQGRHP